MNKQINNYVGTDCSRTSIQSKRVILLSLDWSKSKDPRAPLGHMSILSVLKAANVDVVSIIEPVANFTLSTLSSRVVSLGQAGKETDLAIGVYCWNDKQVRRLIRSVRNYGFKGRIILGGPQISFMEGGFKSLYPEADVFICGDGEEALVNVVQSRGRINFSGVHYGDSLVQIGFARSNLKNLPSPWLQHDWKKEPLGFVRWETMRGCPYFCSYCQHRKKKFGVSYFDRSRLIAEIELFCRNKVSSIAILDPVFNLRSDWSVEILNEVLKRGFKGELALQCRPELITDDFLKVASQLNTKLEFGLQTIHESEAAAVNRTNDMKKVEETLLKTNRLNIKHEVSIIYGLPRQTLSSFLETVEWCMNRNVHVIKAFPLMLLKGTELYYNAAKWRMKESDDAIPCVNSSNSFTEQDWDRMKTISAFLKSTEGRHPKSFSGLFATLSNTPAESEFKRCVNA